MKRIVFTILGSSLLLHACLVSDVHADVTLTETVRVDGKGLMSMASMTIDSTTYISGNKARIDNNVSNTSGLVRMFGGAGPSGQIVRLDQDMLYELNLKKKRYRQISLADQRAEMQKAMAAVEEAQASQSGAMVGVDESQCEWSEPRADVQRTGEKATVAGMSTERVKITATQTCTDRKTNSACDFSLVLDQWLTPRFDAREETLAYYRNYSEKMGISSSGSADFTQRAQQSFGRYKGIWEKVGKEMQNIQGYPLRSSFALGFGGPQCSTASTAQQNAGPGAANPLGQLGGQLGGLFGGKKKQQEAAAPAPEVKMDNGLVPLMVVSSELRSASLSPVSADLFEVPEGYKQQK
jgi:hypothetical protein